MLLLIGKYWIWVLLLAFLWLCFKRFMIDQKKIKQFFYESYPKPKKFSIYMIGAVGTGKTMFIVSLIEEMISKEFQAKSIKFNISYLTDQKEKEIREISAFRDDGVNKRHTHTIVSKERNYFEDYQQATGGTKEPENLYLLLEYKSSAQGQIQSIILEFKDLPGKYLEDPKDQEAYFENEYTKASGMIFIVKSTDIDLTNLREPILFYRNYGHLIQKQYEQKSIPISLAFTQVDSLALDQYQAIKQHESQLFLDWFKHLSLRDYEKQIVYASAKKTHPAYQNIKQTGTYFFSQIIENLEKEYLQLQAHITNVFRKSLIALSVFSLLSIGLLNYMVYREINQMFDEIADQAIQERSLQEKSKTIQNYLSTPVVAFIKIWLDFKEPVDKTLHRLKEKEIKSTQHLLLEISCLQTEEIYQKQVDQFKKSFKTIQNVEAFFKGFDVHFLDAEMHLIINQIELIFDLKQKYREVVINLSQSNLLTFDQLQIQLADQIKRLQVIKERLKENQIKDMVLRSHLENLDIDLLLKVLQKSLSFNDKNIGLNDAELITALANLNDFYPLTAYPYDLSLKEKSKILDVAYQQAKSMIWQKRWASILDQKTMMANNDLYIYLMSQILKSFQEQIQQKNYLMDDQTQVALKKLLKELLDAYYQPENQKFQNYQSEKQIFEERILPWLRSQFEEATNLKVDLQKLDLDFKNALKSLRSLKCQTEMPKDQAQQAPQKNQIDCDLDSLLIFFESQLHRFEQQPPEIKQQLDVMIKQMKTQLNEIKDLLKNDTYSLSFGVMCKYDHIDESYIDRSIKYSYIDTFEPTIRLKIADQLYTSSIILVDDLTDLSQIQLETIDVHFKPFDKIFVSLVDIDGLSDDFELNDDDLLKTKADESSQPQTPSVLMLFESSKLLGIYGLNELIKKQPACQFVFKVNQTLKPWLMDLK